MRINFGFPIADCGLRTADLESFIAQSRNRIGCLPIRNPKSAIRNPKSAIGLLALAVSLASAAGQSDAQDMPARLEQLFRQGVEALKAGQLEKAEQSFLAVLSQGGKAAYVYNNLGIVYQERGEHLKAVPQFREAIRLDPAYGAPRALIGASLLAVGQVPEAARELERAVKMMPAEPLVRLQLARAYERGGNVPAMVDQYRALSEHSPSEPEYAYQLGRAYRKLSEWSYRRIMRRNPRSARIYQTVGQHYVLQGKVDLALRAFQQAAQADPSLPEIHLALAQIYFESGKQAEALREAEQELAIVPESRAAQSLRLKLGGAR